jgi:glycosyltransferase involved in cell wall biosynthesis
LNYSIIIPTLNREKSLGRVLDCIRGLTISPVEVIIINQGKALGFLEEEKLPIRLISCEKKNASYARNLGIHLSESEWLLFLDDDVFFDGDLIEHYAKAVDDLGCDICNGAVVTNNEDLTDKLHPEREAAFIDIWDELSSYRTFSGAVEITGLCTANVLIKRNVLLFVRGFDERFLRLEDVELGIRLKRSGFSVWHDGRPMVLHLHEATGGGREGIKTWSNKYLRGLEKYGLGVMVLMILEHYHWQKIPFFMFRLLRFYLKPSRYYLERIDYPILVMVHVFKSFIWVAQMRLAGPKLLTNPDHLNQK